VASAILEGSENVDTKIELKIGEVPILIAKTIAGFVDDSEVKEARDYADFVRQVGLGVYRLGNRLERDLEALDRSVIAKIEKWGLGLIVKVRKERELVMVFLS
jgi:hypothetical protein